MKFRGIEGSPAWADMTTIEWDVPTCVTAKAISLMDFNIESSGSSCQ
jgi:hypothetical protein